MTKPRAPLGRQIAQLRSHVRQARLFRRLLRPSQVLQDLVRLPVDRYLRDGRCGPPTNITLVACSRCNERCRMCHSSELLGAHAPDLSLGDLRCLLANLGGRKGPSLFLSGGEPFVREDILDFIGTIKAAGVPCGVVTNGTLLDRDRLRRLVALDVDCVIFSLYGPPAVHDAVTRRPGSFEQLHGAVSGLLARRRGTRVILNCAISAENVHVLSEVVRVGEALGVDAVRFEHLNYVTPHELARQDAVWQRLGDPGATVNSFVREPAGADDFHRAVGGLRRIDARVPVILKPDLDDDELRAWYGAGGVPGRPCWFPWRSLFIDGRGDAYPCMFLLHKVGNLLEQPLGEVWNGAPMVRFRRELKSGLFPACVRCCKL